MTDADFADIAAFAAPPPTAVFQTMTAVLLLLGRDQDDANNPSRLGFFDSSAFKTLNTPEKSVWTWTQILNRVTAPPDGRFVQQMYGCGLDAVLLLPQAVAAVARMRDGEPAFSTEAIQAACKACLPLRQWSVAMVDFVVLYTNLDATVKTEILEMAQAMVV